VKRVVLTETPKPAVKERKGKPHKLLDRPNEIESPSPFYALQPNANGRNTKLPTEAAAEQIRKLAGLGMNQKNISIILGVSHEVLTRWIETSPIIANAYSLGLAQGEQKATNVIAKGIQSGDKVCAMFYLKAKHNWRDSGGIEAQVPQPATSRSALLALQQLTDEEVYQLADILNRGSRRAVIDVGRESGSGEKETS